MLALSLSAVAVRLVVDICSTGILPHDYRSAYLLACLSTVGLFSSTGPTLDRCYSMRNHDWNALRCIQESLYIEKGYYSSSFTRIVGNNKWSKTR